MKPIVRLAIHHTGGPRSQTTAQIRAYHMAPKPRGNGWSDIGYHHVIEGDGSLHVGRPLHVMGAHLRGLNSGSIGVAVTGNNLVRGQQWLEPQIIMLRQYVAAWRLLVPGIEVGGHGYFPKQQTACPGISETALAALLRGDSLVQGS